VSKYEITVNGTTFVVEVGDVSSSPVQVVVNGEAKTVEFKSAEGPAAGPTRAASPPEPAAAPKPEIAAAPQEKASGAGKPIVAPMPGKILSIRVKAGDRVTEGDTICTLEAMKMEMPISTTLTGAIQRVHVNVGDNVAYNDPLVTVA